MHWIYLSPHLDDVVYSCGGLIWQQASRGDSVEIWTICAGDPPDGSLSAFAQELHQRWETPHDSVTRRREEDRAACRIVGAEPRHLPIPDCIYRQPGMNYWAPNAAAPHSEVEPVLMYPDRDSLFGPLHPLEARLPWQLAEHLMKMLADAPEQNANARLVAPLTLGGHADHRLTRLAAERLHRLEGLWYYADYPYAAEHLEEVDTLLPPGWAKQSTPLEQAAASAWADGIAAYASQISSFWSGVGDLRASLADYSQRLGGGTLWGLPE